MMKYLRIERQHISTWRFILITIPFIVIVALSTFISAWNIESGGGILADDNLKVMLFNIANSSQTISLLTYWLLFEIGYRYQKGIYRRYLTDGMRRVDILASQYISVGAFICFVFLIMELTIFGAGLAREYSVSEIISAQHGPSWVNQLLYIFFKWNAILFLGNLVHGYYAILVYFLYNIVEQIIYKVGLEYLEWPEHLLNILPFRAGAQIIGFEYMTFTEQIIIILYILIFMGGNYLFVKNKTI